MHEVSVLGCEAASLTVWFPVFQKKKYSGLILEGLKVYYKQTLNETTSLPWNARNQIPSDAVSHPRADTSTVIVLPAKSRLFPKAILLVNCEYCHTPYVIFVICMWTDAGSAKPSWSIAVWAANADGWYWDARASTRICRAINKWGQDWRDFIHNWLVSLKMSEYMSNWNPVSHQTVTPFCLPYKWWTFWYLKCCAFVKGKVKT